MLITSIFLCLHLSPHAQNVSIQDIRDILRFRDQTLSQLSFEAKIEIIQEESSHEIFQHSVWFDDARLLVESNPEGKILRAFREDRFEGESFIAGGAGKIGRHTIGVEKCRELRSSNNAESFGLWTLGLSGQDWLGPHADVEVISSVGSSRVSIVRYGAGGSSIGDTIWRFDWDPDSMLFLRADQLVQWPDDGDIKRPIDSLFFKGIMFGTVQRWECTDWYWDQAVGVAIPTRGRMEIIAEPNDPFPSLPTIINMSILESSIEIGNAVELSDTFLVIPDEVEVEDQRLGLVMTTASAARQKQMLRFLSLVRIAREWGGHDEGELMQSPGNEVPCGISAAFLYLSARNMEVSLSGLINDFGGDSLNSWISIESMTTVISKYENMTPVRIGNASAIQAITEPFIALINPSTENAGHYVVGRVHPEGVEFLDPLEDLRFISFSELEASASNWIFLIPNPRVHIGTWKVATTLLGIGTAFFLLLLCRNKFKRIPRHGIVTSVLAGLIVTGFSCGPLKVESQGLVSTSGGFVEYDGLRPNSIVEHEFVVKNFGTNAILVDEITASCGCSGVEIDKKNIMPGESATVSAEIQMEMVGGKRVIISLMGKDSSPLISLVVEAQVEPTNVILPPVGLVFLEKNANSGIYEGNGQFDFFHRGNPLRVPKISFADSSLSGKVSGVSTRMDIANPGVEIQTFDFTVVAANLEHQEPESKKFKGKIEGVHLGKKQMAEFTTIIKRHRMVKVSPAVGLLSSRAPSRVVQCTFTGSERMELALGPVQSPYFEATLSETNDGYEIKILMVAEPVQETVREELQLVDKGRNEAVGSIPILIRGGQ